MKRSPGGLGKRIDRGRRQIRDRWRALQVAKGFRPNRAVVLAYHRVASPPVDPLQLSVSPSSFAEQLSVLGASYRVVPLRNLPQALSEPVSRPTVAITFDDGYADNLLTMAPLLSKAGLSATVFVASDFIGGRQWFWWDAIGVALFQARRPDTPLTIRCDGVELETINVTDENRKDTHDRLVDHARRASASTAREIARSCLTWAGIPELPDPDYRALTASECRELSRVPSIVVGGHGRHHVSLAFRSDPEAFEDIAEGKKALERVTGLPVREFSFPFGTRADFSSRSIQLAKAAGYERIAVNCPGWVFAKDRGTEIPRVLVRNWPGEQFSRWLDGVFAGRAF